MTSASEVFFEQLGQVGHEPRLTNAKGTVRFDLRDGDQVQHWHVAVLHGDIAVSRDDGPADGVITCDREYFDRVVRGEVNVMSSVLRGLIRYDGDPQLGVIFRRLFSQPAPSGGSTR